LKDRERLSRTSKPSWRISHGELKDICRYETSERVSCGISHGELKEEEFQKEVLLGIVPRISHGELKALKIIHHCFNILVNLTRRIESSFLLAPLLISSTIESHTEN